MSQQSHRQNEVTRILNAAAAGDGQAAEELLPLVYHELRRLAGDRMRKTPPGNTLQPTALVHEAYLRLLGRTPGESPTWEGRHHFFAAAARAMRDILVDQARRKAAVKHGGGRRRQAIDAITPAMEMTGRDGTESGLAEEDLVALNEALKKLETHDARKGQIVMLRYFAGLTQAETAAALDVSERTIEREWRYIKAWLRRELHDSDPP